MRRKGYRGTGCTKRSFNKCEGVCRTYDKIQTVFADILQNDESVVSFQCNVLIESGEEKQYTTDFVAVKSDGSTMVRECVWRKNLSRPLTAKLLDISRNYWRSKGVIDWGIVIEKKEEADEGK